MKVAMLAVSSLFAAITLTGCGGGGSSSGGGNGGGRGGTSSAALSASLTLTGGTFANVNVIPAGSTQNVQVVDAQNKVHTFTSVYSPDTLGDGSTGALLVVMRAGTVLLAGHYTSTSATYINPGTQFTASIPLTASGAIAHDTVIASGTNVKLPIDKIGGLSFPNGVTVSFNTRFNVVQDDQINWSATIPLPSAIANDGKATFTGAGSPAFDLGGNFLTADGSTGINLIGAASGPSPIVLDGGDTAPAGTTSFPNANLSYNYSD